MAFTKKTKQSIIKIGNTIIKKGKKYTLDHKFDGSAPDGLKKIEATRLPFEKNTVIDCIAFDENQSMFDTGFYSQSPCLQYYTQAERDELVPVYIKEIKKPFEALKNVDLSAHDTNEFLKSYRYELYVNKEFDTTKPIEMYELFNALLQGYVCNKDEKNPFYRNSAQFNISNPQDVKNKSREKTKKRRQAFEKFVVMADNNRDKLDLVLEYIGRDNPAKVDVEDLKDDYSIIINDLKTGMDFVERFLEASQKYDSEAGKEEMEFFAGAKRLLKASKIKKDKKGFVTALGEQFLGTSLQDVAKFCMNKDSIQYKTVIALLDEIAE